MLRRRDGDDWRIEPGTHLPRLGRLASDAADADDLAVHLTTLFPPVRPRGWFEVRYLDAQPWRWWPVPMAVLTALLDDAGALGRRRGGLRRARRLGGRRPRRAGRARAAGRRAGLLRRRAGRAASAAASTPTWSRWSPPSATATSRSAAARPTTPSTLRSEAS